jgi:retron-type reverse transcriptase
MANDFYNALKKFDNLHAAWRHVRKSAQQSSNSDIRNAAESYEEKCHTHLKSIQGRLSARSYKFPPAKGVLKDKKKRAKQGKDPRPIVIATLEGRIVQRAILQVLQPHKKHPLHQKLGAIRDVNESPYGIGGTPKPYGGVTVGIKSILNDMNDGFAFFFKSDIKAFFTKIDHEEVCQFIYEQTKDDEIQKIFADGLDVELGNKDELAKYFELFPQNGVGVPQGSSLSAFSGNVLLYEFDRMLNTDSTRTYRYIDDVIILGRDNESVQKARSEAIKWLKKKGMSLYVPAQAPDKAEEGKVESSFTYLGCKVMPNQVAPCKPATLSLLKKVDGEITASKKFISDLLKDDKNRKLESAYIQSLNRIDRIIYGWGKSVSFCNDRLPFQKLDKDIDKKLRDYEEWYDSKRKNLPLLQRRRIMGVSCLQDIESTYITIMKEE